MARTPSIPEPKPQVDGINTAYDQLDCMAAVGAEGADRASGGRWNVTASQVRTASGITDRRGLYDGEVADAIVTLTQGETILAYMRLENPGELRALIGAGHSAGVRINCAVTITTSRRTNWFAGIHEVFANEVRQTAQGDCRCEKDLNISHTEYYVDDPGTTARGFWWWSGDLLYRAAMSAGGGAIFVLATRDTEGVTRSVRQHPQAWTRRGPGLNYQPRRKVAGMAVKVVRTEEGGQWRYFGHDGNAWALVRLPDTGNERWIAACFLR